RAMTRRDYFGALALCIASGLLAPMMTLALAFGGGVLRQAAAHGVQPASATYLIWLLALRRVPPFPSSIASTCCAAGVHGLSF
ncbi:MAG TPA: hypothetical protein VG672_09435, partial [Bryobacteraceae bacterium]|nr:hypothetical protein [Bryobacteraceae bacterium]